MRLPETKRSPALELILEFGGLIRRMRRDALCGIENEKDYSDAEDILGKLCDIKNNVEKEFQSRGMDSLLSITDSCIRLSVEYDGEGGR